MVTNRQLSGILSDYKVMGEDGENYEVETWSPAGEDVVMTLWGKNLQEMSDYAKSLLDDFDPHDHASCIYHAKHYGGAEDRRFYASAPDDLDDLVADAKAIQNIYKDVWDRLAVAARNTTIHSTEDIDKGSADEKTAD